MAPAHVAEGGGGKTPRSLAPAPVWNNTVCQAQAHVFTRKCGNGVLGVEESTDILGRGQQGDGDRGPCHGENWEGSAPPLAGTQWLMLV